MNHRYGGNEMTQDEYYMSIAKDEAKKSKCSRLSVGAVIVKNGRIISTGFNGVPNNLKSCTKDNPCYKQKNNIPSGTIVDASECMSIHSEEFAIIAAAKHGSIEGLSGATIYVTHLPCRKCALTIIAADICRVVYEIEYPDKIGIEFMEQAKIKVDKFPENQKTKASFKSKSPDTPLTNEFPVSSIASSEGVYVC